MVKTIKPENRKLTVTELYLLNLDSETAAAHKMFVTVKALRAMCKLGLPFLKIGGTRYFDFDDLHNWIESPASSGSGITGSNKDLLWAKLPKSMLPRVKDIEGKLCWVVPVDKRLIKSNQPKCKKSKHKAGKTKPGS